ncbi:Uncharacterized conserved protein, DUF924 family [Monaibacterium marinum]|uniref:Uncharacterized conserved protein, DUF924 family n=1 Tax=Pontivivens marinum TaxID=1690039 RepID=A0A2C9CQN2_9RHOB|nr:Uncharacterized conserved protein, DUF924 family [Monaibacterium marinum]
MTDMIANVLSFWIEEVGEKGWYIQDDDLDATITDRFGGLWQQVADGELSDWLISARGVLALLIVTDQFPRNMFRGQGKSFATDAMAMRVARMGILRRDDLHYRGPERQFFYLPMMHAESISHQEHAVRQFMLKMPKSASNLFHARAHRDVIRTYGRFPYRNAALGRSSTKAEESYILAGGYGATLRAMHQAEQEQT